MSLVNELVIISQTDRPSAQYIVHLDNETEEDLGTFNTGHYIDTRVSYKKPFGLSSNITLLKDFGLFLTLINNRLIVANMALGNTTYLDGTIRAWQDIPLALSTLKKDSVSLVREYLLKNPQMGFDLTSKNPDIDKATEIIWEEFGDTPINNDDEILEPFYFFPAGTDRFIVWKWVELFSDTTSVAELMRLTA